MLKQQGHVVVRGPTHTSRANQQKTPEKKNKKDVVLTVESPSTANVAIESDNQDENVNITNRSSDAKPKKGRKIKGRRSGAIAHRSKGISRRKSELGASNDDNRQSNATKKADKPRQDRPVPRPKVQRTYSSSLDEGSGRLDPKAKERTPPPELLAPIMVPRMSQAFDGERSKSPGPSQTSWVDECAERYDDIDEDLSSGIVRRAAVGKEKVVHTADVGLGGLRAKRKSKPFVHAGLDLDEAPPAAPDSSYSDLRLEGFSVVQKAGDVVPDLPLSRQISAGVMSEDIEIVDTTDLYRIPSPLPKKLGERDAHDGVTYVRRKSGLSSRPPGPSGIMRRASTSTKRKTVSFHDESPVIIEPNLRAPSRSLPRDAYLSKSSSENSEFKDALDTPSSSFSGLRKPRDSMHVAANKPRSRMFSSDISNANDSRKTGVGAPTIGGQGALEVPDHGSSLVARPSASSIPQTMDIPRARMYRELSDSSGAEDASFRARSSKRMSRISSRDKTAIAEASKRQSQAVAQAMMEQIKGRPKSAMLAFNDHEVLISDDDPLDEVSDDSFRRKSRQSKVINAPLFVPGVVPAPPPPPPFAPSVPRARSVRNPPPPPASPQSSSQGRL